MVLAYVPLSDLFLDCRQGSNPLKMGVPKRVPSLNTQVEGKCRELGGINAIHRCDYEALRVKPFHTAADFTQ